MRSFSFIVLALSFVACSSDTTAATPDATPPVTPTASGVFPAAGYSGRVLRVEVTGDSTSWSASTTMSFGAGITVGTISVASPTDLFAEITIADTAAVGMHDVTVTDGTHVTTLSKAFEVDSPIIMETGGDVAQGSVARFAIRQLDFGAPFNLACKFSNPFTGQCLLYSNLSVTTPPGVVAQISSASDYQIQGTLFIDVDAPAVGGTYAVSSGTVISTLGTTLPTTARTAKALTAATASSSTVTAGGSVLFQLSAAATTANRFVATPTMAGTTAQLILLPASGHFADQLPDGFDDQGTALAQHDGVATTATTFYAIYVDDGSASPLSMLATAFPLVSVNKAANTTTVATAQTVSKQALLNNAALASVTDQAWVKFNVAVGDVGKHVHVTTAGDAKTDALVMVQSNLAGSTTLGTSPDQTYQEDFLSAVIPAGTTTISVQISASQAGYFDATHNTYVAAIWLE